MKPALKTEAKTRQRLLAEHLTSNQRVVAASIGLSLGKAEANEFFALRKAWGIDGYIDADAAEKIILASWY